MTIWKTLKPNVPTMDDGPSAASDQRQAALVFFLPVVEGYKDRGEAVSTCGMVFPVFDP